MKSLERKKGISTYIILQMMPDCAIQYMDDRHNLTAEMEKVMSIFEHMEGWRDALNLADTSANKIIGEAPSTRAWGSPLRRMHRTASLLSHELNRLNMERLKHNQIIGIQAVLGILLMVVVLAGISATLNGSIIAVIITPCLSAAILWAGDALDRQRVKSYDRQNT